MMQQNRDPDLGRGTLGDKLPVVAAPAMLDSVRGTLESRGLIKRPRRGTTWPLRASLLAAGIVLGLLAGRLRSGPTAPTALAPPGISLFALLLYGDLAGDTGAVAVARAQEYGRWASNLPGARFVEGNELGDVLTVLGRADSLTATPETPAGYFIIEAASPEHALEIARTCPHVKYGGRVVVMSIPDRTRP